MEGDSEEQTGVSLLGLLGWKSQRGQSGDGELVTSRDVDEQMRGVPKEHPAVEDTRPRAGRAPAARVR